MGGWFALRSAAASPERFDRIVAMGFQLGADMADAPLLLRLPAPGWATPTRVRLRRSMVLRMLKVGGMRAAVESGRFSEPMLQWMSTVLGSTETIGNDARYAPRPMGLCGPTDEIDLGPDVLSRITSPVHLFWGEDDPFGGRGAAHGLAERLPDASIEMIPGAGHAPWIDAPEAATAAVRRHFDV